VCVSGRGVIQALAACLYCVFNKAIGLLAHARGAKSPNLAVVDVVILSSEDLAERVLAGQGVGYHELTGQ
jgi:hypothetical protein